MASATQTIEILEDGLAQVQSALGTAQHVLQVVDATEQNVRRAGQAARRGLLLLLVIAVVAGIVIVIRGRSQTALEDSFDQP